MRRCVVVSLALTLLVALLGTSADVASAPTVRVFLHGNVVSFPDQQPVIVDGRTLVPVRGLFDALGADVQWEPEALRVTVRWRGNQAAVFVGSRTAWVNGEKKTLDVAPRIMGDRTMVPLRFLAESLGLNVDWYDRYQAVVIGERPALPVLAPADNPNLVMPCTIRVAIRPVPSGEYEPRQDGPYVVKEVELSEYVVRVVAHEFGDFTDDNGVSHSFTAEPLKAGAMAAMMYAWAYAWHPAQSDYDLDNSKRFQVYIPDKPYAQKHVDAVRDIWGTFMVRQEGLAVFAPQYGSGWYSDRSRGTDWLNQRGSLYLSDTRGYSWEQILGYYYRGVQLQQHAHPCAGP